MDEAARTVTIEYSKMYKRVDGNLTECWFDPTGSFQYPDDCSTVLGSRENTVPRDSISYTAAGAWCVAHHAMAGGFRTRVHSCER